MTEHEELLALRNELARLRAILSTPGTEDFVRDLDPPLPLTAEREQTQTLLDRVGVFDVSHSSERELLSVIRLLCECMIEEGLCEDE